MEIKDNYDTLEGKEVSVAGRMMFKRVMGKASFCNIQDLQGNIQSYVARDDIGEDSYKDFKKYDVGDILGIKGFGRAKNLDVHTLLLYMHIGSEGSS